MSSNFKLKISTKKIILLVGIVILNFFFIFIGRNVKQNNKETLFLEKLNKISYKHFAKLVSEKKTLVVKVDFSNMKSSQKDQFINKIIKYKIEHTNSDVSYLLAEDLYKNKIGKSFSEKIKFFHKYNKLMMKMVSEDYYTFLIIFNKSNLKLVKNEINILHKTFDSQNIKINFSGMPYVNYLLNVYSKDIKNILFPILFIACFLFTFLITLNFWHSFLMIISCVFSLTTTIALVALLYTDLNMITSSVPVIVFVINLSLAYHLYFSCLEIGNLKDAIKLKIKAISLTVITTLIGFGSLALSPIEIIHQFAVLSVLSISITTILSLLWFDIFSEYFVISKEKKYKLDNLLQTFFKFDIAFFTFKTFKIWSFIIITLIISYFSISKIKFLTDATEYFPKSSGIKKNLDQMDKTFLGNPSLEVVFSRINTNINSKKSDDENQDNLLDFKLIKLMSELETKIKSSLLVKTEVKILSISSLVKEANYLYSNNYAFPQYDMSFYPLYSRLSENIKKSYPLNAIYRFTVMDKAVNYKEYSQRVNIIKKEIIKFIDEHQELQGFKFEFNGLQFQMMQAQKNLISVLLKSFSLSLFLISCIAFLLYKKIKLFLIFFITNTMPIILTLIMFYVFSLSINIATVMTFSISLGMIVDASIHIVEDYQNKISEIKIYKTTLLPIFFSSIVLIFAFSMFAFNDFLPIRQVGISIALTLLFGLCFDLFVFRAFIKKIILK